MNQELKDKLKEAVGSLAHAEYEGQMIALGAFYITPDGQVKNIVACDSCTLLPMIGASNVLQSLIMSSLPLRKSN